MGCSALPVTMQERLEPPSSVTIEISQEADCDHDRTQISTWVVGRKMIAQKDNAQFLEPSQLGRNQASMSHCDYCDALNPYVRLRVEVLEKVHTRKIYWLSSSGDWEKSVKKSICCKALWMWPMVMGAQVQWRSSHWCWVYNEWEGKVEIPPSPLSRNLSIRSGTEYNELEDDCFQARILLCNTGLNLRHRTSQNNLNSHMWTDTKWRGHGDRKNRPATTVVLCFLKCMHSRNRCTVTLQRAQVDRPESLGARDSGAGQSSSTILTLFLPLISCLLIEQYMCTAAQ